MIDTVRFKASIGTEARELLKKRAFETSKNDNISDTNIYKFWNASVRLNSYDRNINIIFDDFQPDCIFFELSIPKFLYGHNLYLISFQEFTNGCIKLFHNLSNYFGSFPPVDSWEINRIDLCYAWDLGDEQKATELLKILKCYKFPRLKDYPYKTSVYYVSQNTTVKVYLKGAEFYKDDFKALQKLGLTDQAFELYNVSKGIVRFEVELRKRALQRTFKLKTIFLKDLNSNNLNKILKQKFKKMYKHSNLKIENTYTISQKLNEAYKPRKARSLYTFYKMFTSSDETDKQYIREMPRSTVWYNLKQIDEADCGFIAPTTLLDTFDFTIPSVSVVDPKKYGRTPIHADQIAY